MKIKIIPISFRQLIILLFLVFSPCVSFAAPAISSVSGNITRGGTITIDGTNFGTKNPAKPWVWADFEGGVVQADPNYSQGTINIYGSSPTLHISSSGLETHSKYGAAGPAATSSGKTGVGFNTIFSSGTNKVFFFGRKKYANSNFLDNVTNYKWLRLYSSTSGSSYTNFLLAFANYGSKFTGFTNEQATSIQSIEGAYDPNNTWLIQEVQLYHGSSAGSSDASIKYWRNGVKKADKTFLGSTSSYSSLEWRRVSVENFITNDLPVKDADVIYDDIYIDNTWSRVMIGNASTFDACTHREIQIPTAWSSSQITVKGQTGTIVSGATAYLYVVDSSGNVNASGYPITIGGSTITSQAPSAPTSLRILQ
jgi:hypothetical protein